jgi:hypothetical protein
MALYLNVVNFVQPNGSLKTPSRMAPKRRWHRATSSLHCIGLFISVQGPVDGKRIWHAYSRMKREWDSMSKEDTWFPPEDLFPELSQLRALIIIYIFVMFYFSDLPINRLGYMAPS